LIAELLNTSLLFRVNFKAFASFTSVKEEKVNRCKQHNAVDAIDNLIAFMT